LNDRVFRIGHLGDFNDVSIAGTLAGVEIGLKYCGIPHNSGGGEAALSLMTGNAGPGGSR
jgi:alanine-glyoxylate transaminase / serine-glyoxylate transaminase / serine-pyruvate transaminase